MLKRYISIFLMGILVSTAGISGASVVYAVDTTSAATEWVEETPAPVVKPAPEVKPALPVKPVTPVTIASGENTYKVVSGDTLWRIAQRLGVTLQNIIALNPQIANPDRIYVGQVIYVKKATAPTTPATPIVETPGTVNVTKYPDGTYRGTFYDSGEQQVGVQFTLANGKVSSASLRTLAYKGVDFKEEKTDEKIVALAGQYNELINYLVGKNVPSAIQDLYAPGNISKDVKVGTDAFSGATVRSSKIISAMNDGLNRGLYSVAAPSIQFENGTYRGTFIDGGEQQVGVQFTLADNKVAAISYRDLIYKGVDYKSEKTDAKVMGLNEQYVDLINYLVGKDLRLSLNNLYNPGFVVGNKVVGPDTYTGATLRSSKIITAINDGLNRGVYTYSQGAVPAPALSNKSFENGTYRGAFIDGGEQQVGVQVKLENNIVKDITYRVLAYKGINFSAENAELKVAAMNQQYNELIKFLIGKDIRTNIAKLYAPGTIVQDKTIGADIVSGATIRSSKVVSSITDAMNRGIYSK